MNILLVDDDELDRKLVIRTLKKSNLEVIVTEAQTVNEALQYYVQETFDVVLLDYRMPQKDGIEMMVEIKNIPQNSNTAIVMMSNSENDSLAIECIKAGAQDFLVKSDITGTRLRRALQHATARFQLTRGHYQTYQKAKALAETDPLTGLPNRYYFDETLKKMLISNQRNKQMLALLLVDLDRFKLINDNFGHDTGDILLKKVVAKISSCLRGNELFSHLGGNEFAIVLDSLTSIKHVNIVARRIITVMQEPIKIGSTLINVTASIGIALHPENGTTSELLFKYADIAMYKSKKLGRNQVCFFEEEMQHQFQYRLMILTELQIALSRNQFELFYQPIIRPNDNTLLGFEALIRWNIGNTLRPPIEFIEIAEETRDIKAIGLWVAEDAIRTLSKWNSQRVIPLRMAINVSAIQLTTTEFPKCLAKYLQDYNVPPELIDIELTETVLLEDTQEVNDAIFAIAKMGCKLSLDDFGTGFSSLAHLQNYPISIVKIDKSLMPKNDLDSKNRSLVEGVTSMARILGLEIVAEGIESEQHVNFCNTLDITNVQGYFYSHPLAMKDVEKMYLN